MLWDNGLGGLTQLEPAVLGWGILLLVAVGASLVFVFRFAASSDARPDAGAGPSVSRRLLLALALILGAGLFAYFAPGDIAGGDAHAHVARTWLYSDAFAKEHSFPIWTYRWYLGYPLGLHYGLLYFASSGLWTALLPFDVYFATKLFLWAAHVGSGLLMFRLVRLTARSALAAVIASVVYAFSFLHLGPLLLSGHLPLSLVFVLLPAALLVFESWDRARIADGRLETGSTKASWQRCGAGASLLAIVLALSLVNHLQYGLYTTLVVGIWLLVRTALGARAADGRFGQRLRFGLLTLAVTAILAAWFVVPALTEGDGLVLSSSNVIEELVGGISLGGLRDALDLFLWSRVMRNWSYYYVGWVPLGLAMLALLTFLPIPRLRMRPDAGVGVALAVGLASFALSILNPRFSPFWLCFVAILAGHGAAAGLALVGGPGLRTSGLRNDESGSDSGRGRRSRRRVVAATTTAALALLIDLGPSLIQSPYREVDNSRLRELGIAMAERSEIGRVLELEPGKGTLWRSLDVVDTGCSTPFGGIPQAATKALPFVAAVACEAVREIVDEPGTLTPSVRNALRLFNVDYVTVPGSGSPRALPGSPAWFASEAEISLVVDPLERIDWYTMKKRFDRRDLDASAVLASVGRMEVDAQEPLLARVILHRGEILPGPGEPSGSGERGGPTEPTGDAFSTAGSGARTRPVPEFTILAEEETHGTVRVRYRCSTPGYILLPYAYSNNNRTEFDGKRTKSLCSSLYLTVVPTPAGEHEILLRAGITGSRRGLSWLSGLGLLGSLLLIGVGRFPIRSFR